MPKKLEQSEMTDSEKQLLGEHVPANPQQVIGRQIARYMRKAELHRHIVNTNEDERDEHSRLADECERLMHELDDLWDKLDKGEVSVNP